MLRVLQKYSHYVPYFCGDAGIEAGCKQVLIMLLRGVVNFIRLAAGFDICSIKLTKQTNI